MYNQEKNSQTTTWGLCSKPVGGSLTSIQHSKFGPKLTDSNQITGTSQLSSSLLDWEAQLLLTPPGEVRASALTCARPLIPPG